MTRHEHVAWAKKRALEYVDAGQPMSAITSMCSDLGKHDETRSNNGYAVAMLLAPIGGSAAQVRKWVEGFN